MLCETKKSLPTHPLLCPLLAPLVSSLAGFTSNTCLSFLHSGHHSSHCPAWPSLPILPAMLSSPTRVTAPIVRLCQVQTNRGSTTMGISPSRLLFCRARESCSGSGSPEALWHAATSPLRTAGLSTTQLSTGKSLPSPQQALAVVNQAGRNAVGDAGTLALLPCGLCFLLPVAELLPS